MHRQLDHLRHRQKARTLISGRGALLFCSAALMLQPPGAFAQPGNPPKTGGTPAFPGGTATAQQQPSSSSQSPNAGLTFPSIPAPGPLLNKPATGEAARPTDLAAPQQQTDQSVINTQAAEFQQRYLSGEVIELQLPRPNQLLSLGGSLPPIRLEANYTEPISLKSCLMYALEHNLAIGIQQANRDAQQWTMFGSYGGFLPNIIMNFQHQLLDGSSLIGGIIPTTYHTPNTSAQAGVQWYAFQGGGILFNSLQQTHSYRAARAAVKGTLNDTLLAVTKAYYNLVNNQALLQIQTRAVDVSRAQVTLNKQLESAGTGTRFQVLQSETQLARDEQNLLAQEVLLRNSSIDLATTLNVNAGVNFLSVEQEVRKVRLIDPSLDVNHLLVIAILNRPELKQFEEIRVAARRAIQVAAAPLYPQAQFFANIFGNGATLGHSHVTSQAVTTVPVDTLATATPLSVPGVTPVTQANSTFFNSATAIGPPSTRDRDMKRSYSIGARVDWNYSSLGIPTAASVMTAKAQARAALLNSNQQLLYVIQQVRESYLNSQTAERQIEVADKGVISSAEELRLARVRLANGVGTNIDVINAQRDFITALVTKANAIIQFNIAQVQLLHDIGVVSVDTVTSGRLIRQ
jgi:outer membrane protein TolC